MSTRDHKDNALLSVTFVCLLVVFSLEFGAVVTKLFGESSAGWFSTLLFPVIIGAIMWIFICAPFAVLKIKRLLRKRKTDRRVIRQAKAAGVWDKPQVLGGRALELKAWKLYRITRGPGETDKDLRRRCMTRADNELANTQK